MCAPALVIGQALGRMGCQLSGDGDWGMPSTLPWAMAYPKAIVGWNAETVLKLDGQSGPGFGVLSGRPGASDADLRGYSVYAAFSRFVVVTRNSHVEGRILYLYMILAGAARFMVEFVRINPRVFMG